MRHGLLRVALVMSWGGIPALVDADPFIEGNVLVSMADTLFEYSVHGERLQALPVPYGGGTRPETETTRDITFDLNGNLVAFDGGYSPYLGVYDSGSDTWSHHSHPGWSTFNRFGGIAQYDRFVFVTDMETGGDGSPKGVIRFDVSNGFTSQRFAEHANGLDLAFGPDGNLYTLVTEIDIELYDPTSLTPQGSLRLETPCRGIGFSEDGTLFGCTWDGLIYRLSSSGAVVDSIDTGVGNLNDLDFLPDGTLVAGSRLGSVVVSNQWFTSIQSFPVGEAPTFVSFVRPLPATSASVDLVPEIALLPPKPNPFNRQTTIRFTTKVPARIQVNVFDISGRKTRTLLDAVRAPGVHETVWNGRDASERLMPAGVYFFETVVGATREVESIVLVR